MIEIVEVRNLGGWRAADIIISNGGQVYFYQVSQLPLAGNLQTMLNNNEAQLWALASAEAKTVDYFELNLKRVLKSFALVVLDEINILRNAAQLPPRTANQIEMAIKEKLKNI